MRRTGLGILLTGVLFAATAVAEDFPNTAPLEAFDAPQPYLRNYPGGRPAAPADQKARSFLLGETRVVLVDMNGNGRFSDRGSDGWTLAGDEYRYVVPLERWIVVGKQQVWLRIAEDGASVSWRAETFVPVERPGERLQKPLNIKRRKPGQILAALVRWNDLRLRNGLVPGWLDNDLSAGCHAHADYCTRHGITHKEDPNKERYTQEGADAGRWSGIGAADVTDEVDLAYRAFFHRMQLIHATTESIGIGYAPAIAVLDGSRGRGRRKWTYPVIVPAPGTEGHPRSFSFERPVPHPEAFGSARGLRGVGCPITLTWERAGVTDVEAELREKGPDGKAVKFLLSWEEKPANPEIPDNYKTIGLIPRTSLKSRTLYWVRVRYSYKGEKAEREWTFTTGR